MEQNTTPRKEFVSAEDLKKSLKIVQAKGFKMEMPT